MTTPSDEELDRLLELQRIDNALRKARHQLARLPEQQAVDAATARASELDAGIAALEDRLAAARAEGSRIEREISALALRRDEERQRLYAGGLSNAREIQAVEAEIASTERRIGEHEDELLGVMEVVEGLESEVGALASDRAVVAGELEALTAARDATAAVALEGIASIEAERAEVVVGVPEGLLADYVAAAEGSGIGIGMLERGGCTACGNTLPSRVVSELMAGPTLTRCPECARLLVLPG